MSTNNIFTLGTRVFFLRSYHKGFSTESLTVNFDNQAEKSLILSKLRDLRGKWNVTVKQFRHKRSQQANSYYWAAWVPLFMEWMADQGIELSKEAAHEIVKKEANPVEVVSPKTGEVKVFGGPTHNMSVQEFNRFMDRAAVFFTTFCGFKLPPPRIYHMLDDGPPDDIDPSPPANPRAAQTLAACKEAVERKG